MRKLVLTLLLLSSCKPATPHDCRREAEAVCKRLARDLQKVESKEDLQKIAPKLQKRFIQLADLTIKAKELKIKEGEEILGENKIITKILLPELKRIYGLEGGRPLLEKIEREALHKLDAVNHS